MFVSVLVCALLRSVSFEKVKMAPIRRKSVAKKVTSTRISQDETSQSSQKSKTRAKNYSAEECQALIKCCDKFHTIITKNSNSDKDKNEKQQAWDKIKNDFDIYCKSHGIYVSNIKFFVCLFFSSKKRTIALCLDQFVCHFVNNESIFVCVSYNIKISSFEKNVCHESV